VFLAVVVFFGIAEFYLFVRHPVAFGAMARLPLFLSRTIELDDSWMETLRRVDPQDGPYRERLRFDLRPLASAIPVGRLDVVGAETTVSALGAHATVQIQERMPVWRFPVFLVARLRIATSPAGLRVRASGYPVFMATFVFAAIGSLWFGPRSETSAVAAGVGAVWSTLTIGVTRAKVESVLDRLAKALSQPRLWLHEPLP
jgi:hypothetical protein